MSIRLKVSYEEPEELRHLLERIRPDVKSWKVARNREGRFKKAYIELHETGAKRENT